MAEHPVPKHQRDSYEATNEALILIDGLISALDVIQEHIQMQDNQGPAAKAFHTVNPLLRNKMAEVWRLRDAEWESIGGK